MPKLSKREQDELKRKVLEKYGEDHSEHRNRVNKYEDCYKAYRAQREMRAEASEGSDKPLPAYVFQSVETMAANTLDANPRWRLKVLPQVTDDYDRIHELQAGARANEALLQHQLSVDKWAEKQRVFDLQALILGITGSKQSWDYRKGPKRRRNRVEIPDKYGEMQVTYEPVTDMVVFRDNPTAEVIDMRHLILQKGATSLQNSDRITHRVYKSMEQLRRLECKKNGGKFHDGPCEPGKKYHNLDQLSESDAGEHHEQFSRESDLWSETPHSNGLELLEHWYREGNNLRVCTVAAQKVLIEERSNPFWLDHLDHPFPFVVGSGTPDLFRLPGVSEVEMMAELQRMLWDLIEQRLTNLQLVNNAVMLIADDVMDPDEFGEIEPGAKFLVPRPLQETVQWWAPDVRVASLSMEAEALLKGDLQNVTGGMPFLSGTNSSGVDQETATGVSIVTSLAQKRLAAKRQQFIWMKGRIGEQWCALNQQFIMEERLVPITGEDGAEAYEEIRPEMLDGIYLFEVEMVEESMNRQEKRAESQAKLTTAAQIMAPMAMSGTPLNMKAFMDDYLDAFGIADKDRYYTQQNPLPAAVAPAEGTQGAEQGADGTTNPELAAGTLSPSNENSMSPEASMQQFMSQRGAVN